MERGRQASRRLRGVEPTAPATSTRASWLELRDARLRPACSTGSPHRCGRSRAGARVPPLP